MHVRSESQSQCIVLPEETWISMDRLSSSPDSVRPPDNFKRPKKVTRLNDPYDPSSLGLSVPTGSLQQVYEWCRQIMPAHTGPASVASSPRSPASTGSHEQELIAELEEQIFGPPAGLMLAPKAPSKSTPVRRGKSKSKTLTPPPFVVPTAKGIQTLFRINPDEAVQTGSGPGNASSNVGSAASSYVAPPQQHVGKARLWLFVAACMHAMSIFMSLLCCSCSVADMFRYSMVIMNHGDSPWDMNKTW